MIEVTARDVELGDEDTTILKPGMYVVICAEPIHVEHEQWYGNGTVVLTLKRRKPTAETPIAEWERELLEKQAQDEADLADINRRVAAERKVIEAAKAWRAALPWQTGVPRDKYAERLADTQDALCMAVDGLPGDSHVAPTNSQTWEQDGGEEDQRSGSISPWLDSDADLLELLYGMACSARDPVAREGGLVGSDWDAAFVRARDHYHAWLDRWVSRDRAVDGLPAEREGGA